MNEENVKKIVFVCMGNTCRSPMAEAALRSEMKRLRIENAEVSSAGLKGNGFPMNENTAKTLINKGLDLNNFSSKTIGEQTFLATAVIGLTEQICEELKKIRNFGIEVGKLKKGKENVYSFKEIVGYDIPDPYGQGQDAYEETFLQIERGMSAIIDKFFVEKAEETPEKPIKTTKKRASVKKSEKTQKTPSKKATTKKTTSKKTKKNIEN